MTCARSYCCDVIKVVLISHVHASCHALSHRVLNAIVTEFEKMTAHIG